MFSKGGAVALCVLLGAVVVCRGQSSELRWLYRARADGGRALLDGLRQGYLRGALCLSVSQVRC